MTMAADWQHALAPVTEHLAATQTEIARRRAAGEPVLPAESDVLRAFDLPLSDVRAVIIGQDPYPTPGHPIGLSFAVESHVRPLPRSLTNIYRELESDLGIPPAAHGDLSAWQRQGVLLLNRVLTVRAGEAGSHRGLGWEAVTECAIQALAARAAAGAPLVVILWGREAQQLAGFFEPFSTTAVITSAHPSPLSARRGFFGSRPFSRANAHLEAHGAAPIDWRISDDESAAVHGSSTLW